MQQNKVSSVRQRVGKHMYLTDFKGLNADLILCR